MLQYLLLSPLLAPKWKSATVLRHLGCCVGDAGLVCEVPSWAGHKRVQYKCPMRSNMLSGVQLLAIPPWVRLDPFPLTELHPALHWLTRRPNLRLVLSPYAYYIRPWLERSHRCVLPRSLQLARPRWSGSSTERTLLCRYDGR